MPFTDLVRDAVPDPGQKLSETEAFLYDRKLTEIILIASVLGFVSERHFRRRARFLGGFLDLGHGCLGE